jgi:hypothetical protein
MLGSGSTTSVISPDAVKAFSIPGVNCSKPVRKNDVSRGYIRTEGLLRIPLGLSLRNHRCFNEEDHASEVLKTQGDYDALIPAWYLEKHKARGTMTSHLHFPHCPTNSYGHGKIHCEYSITSHKRVSLSDKGIHFGAVVMSKSSL